ncbi:MAG: response regulator [Thiobacillus sp.]|nr:response regulator [Thiobacillus sp.]
MRNTPEANAARQDLTRVRLMVVDDSSVIRNRIARIAGNGLLNTHIVGLARNGLEAVRLCAQYQPDLVTLDLTMPEMDGIDCVDALVKLKPDIRVLVVSALSDKVTALEAIKRGANGFLFKPFTDEQLVQALKELSQ